MADGEKVKQVASKAKAKVHSGLSDLWWMMLVRGLISVCVAVCAFVWPQQTIGLLVKLLGVYFLVDSAVGFAGLLRGQKTQSQLPQIAVSLVVGLILVFWGDISIKIFMVLVGVWALLQGVGMFWMSRNMDDSAARSMMFGLGIAMAIVGAIFVFWPTTAIVTLSWLLALATGLIGCLLIFVALKLRKLCNNRLQPHSDPAV